MIGLLSKVKIIDNSGGLEGRCLKVLKPGNNPGIVGDIIVVSVIKISSGSLIQKGDVHKALIVRSKSSSPSPSTDSVKFSDNAVILIKGLDFTPLGTRIKGPISSRISQPKLRSLAKFLI